MHAAAHAYAGTQSPLSDIGEPFPAFLRALRPPTLRQSKVYSREPTEESKASRLQPV